VVPEYSATLGFPDEDRVALNGDHLTIAKHVSKRDPNFVKIATRLHRLVSELRRHSRRKEWQNFRRTLRLKAHC
jgi:hypothetical protein